MNRHTQLPFTPLSFLSPTPDPPMPCLPPPPKLENPYRANFCLSLTPQFRTRARTACPDVSYKRKL